MAIGPSYSKVADGNIAPSRFVTFTGAGQDRVVQATAGAGSAGDPIYGISQPGPRNTPLAPLDDGFCAIKDETLMIYGAPNKDVILELGGTVAQGDKLKSNASGQGITTTTTADNIGAIAEEAGVSGDLIRVQVIFPTLY